MLPKPSAVWVLVASALVACGDSNEDAPTPSTATTGGGASTSSGSTSGSGGTSTTTSSSGNGGGNSSSGGGGSGGANSDIPGGGTLLFSEAFDDNSFVGRDWYDSNGGDLSNDAASGKAFECHFLNGGTNCDGGSPARHKFADSESVYMGFRIKLSANWQGSGQSFHPHMFHFLTNLDPDYVGPSNSHMTTYQEIVQGRAMLAIQDSMNVDNGCILLNNDSVVGCNGDFSSYAFTEQRSASACNGLLGYLEGRDCFDSGGSWYSSRSWRSAGTAFSDDAWHAVEIYYELNSIQSGIGLADGKIRWVQDGQTLISSDEILFRTGANPSMAFNQFAMLPYIGSGSPVDQYFWLDELVVATARP